MKIIADRAIAKSLETWLGIPTDIDGTNHAATGEHLILVYVNGLPSNHAYRSNCGGLQEVDRLLTNPEQEIAGLFFVSFETRDSLLKRAEQCPSVTLLEPELDIPFSQLPILKSEMRHLLNSARSLQVWGQDNWRGWLIRLEAANRLLRV